MTARERILAKPEAVQILLRACMTKASIGDPAPDWENYAGKALEWWQAQVIGDIRFSALEENQVAEFVIEHLRTLEVWGKILREGTQ